MNRERTGIESTHELLAHQRPIRSRFLLWGSNLEQNTSEVLPGVLWIVLGIYIIWFGVFLIFAIDNEPIEAHGLGHVLVLVRVVVGGVLPVVGAYLVGSDKPAGQWYVPLSLALLFLAVLSRGDFEYYVIDRVLIAALALFVAVTVFTVFSPSAQAYYRNLREQRIG